MSIGAVQSGSSYSSYESGVTRTSGKSSDVSASRQAEASAVYEASKTDKTTSKTANSALIAKMKADTNSRISQMQSLVEKIFKDQGLKINSVDDMWKKLANGEFTADADTIAQAKEDISDNGYWGVSQTSDRIYDFAMALSGGDEEKMQKMKEAVEKGFKEATKSWGKDLPDISSRTYDAVMKKFDDFFNKNTTASDSAAE